MKFKEAIEMDLKNTFHNTDEFAKNSEIYYDGNFINIPIMIQKIDEDMKKDSSYNDNLLYTSHTKVFINNADISFEIKKNHNIQIEGIDYKILDVSNDFGSIILDLEGFDE